MSLQIKMTTRHCKCVLRYLQRILSLDAGCRSAYIPRKVIDSASPLNAATSKGNA